MFGLFSSSKGKTPPELRNYFFDPTQYNEPIVYVYNRVTKNGITKEFLEYSQEGDLISVKGFDIHENPFFYIDERITKEGIVFDSFLQITNGTETKVNVQKPLLYTFDPNKNIDCEMIMGSGENAKRIQLKSTFRKRSSIKFNGEKLDCVVFHGNNNENGIPSTTKVYYGFKTGIIRQEYKIQGQKMHRQLLDIVPVSEFKIEDWKGT